jgi:NADPH-dependent 2,4-dienoyl-CoA reductase/sulfur reductase-like enzyme
MSTLPYSQLIVATGATDRVLPFPGWTLPGVYTLGAAQVALKFQGCAIGSRVVFAGTGPLLYLIACQYAKAGAKVAAVLDTASFAGKAAAVPAMLRQPALLAKGLYYLGWLRAHGVAVHQGVELVRATGGERVQAMHWRKGGREHQVDCDGVGFGYALRPETQLADLLGCRFRYDGLQRGALPERDAVGRSSVPGVYLAGDGAGIMGADAAEWAGERAALALLTDTGHRIDLGRAALLERQLARTAEFRQGPGARLPLPGSMGGQGPRRTGGVPLRRNHGRRVAPLRGRHRRARDEPPQGADTRRHGPLPGPYLRRGGRRNPGASLRRAARCRGPAARAVAHQAAAVFGRGRAGDETGGRMIERITADVAIVGGGIMGSSAALFLRRMGFSVVLLERDLCGSRSSGVNYGGVRRQGRPLSQLPLSQRAQALWARLPELIGTTANTCSPATSRSRAARPTSLA